MHKMAMRFTTFLFTLFVAGTALAQTGTITGTVEDNTGAGVPKVSINAKNLATAATRTTETSSAGTYTLADLPAGNYQVTAQKTDFAAAKYYYAKLSPA